MEKSFRHGLVRRKSRTKIQPSHDHRSVNEQQVEDITLDLFYKPHTLSLLAFLLEWISRGRSRVVSFKSIIMVSSKKFPPNDF